MIPADQAVEELIQKYGKLVFHTIYGMTGDWEESQDLTQDTFHQALKAIDAARSASGSQFREKAWLMRIALNTVRMQRRRRSLFRFIPFSHLQKGKQTRESLRYRLETLNERAAPVQPAGYGASESDDPAELIAERDAVQRTMARSQQRYASACCFRSLAISQPAKLRACSICKRRRCGNVSRERGNNSNGCMSWKMESGLTTMARLPRVQALHRDRQAPAKTPRGVLRAV